MLGIKCDICNAVSWFNALNPETEMAQFPLSPAKEKWRYRHDYDEQGKLIEVSVCSKACQDKLPPARKPPNSPNFGQIHERFLP